MTLRLVICDSVEVEGQGNTDVRVYEPEAGPETIIVDGFHGIYPSSGTFKINIVADLYAGNQHETSPDNPDRPLLQRVITHRLVLAPETLQSIVQWLNTVVITTTTPPSATIEPDK